jgi:hypothetical protein
LFGETVAQSFLNDAGIRRLRRINAIQWLIVTIVAVATSLWPMARRHSLFPQVMMCMD